MRNGVAVAGIGCQKKGKERRQRDGTHQGVVCDVEQRRLGAGQLAVGDEIATHQDAGHQADVVADRITAEPGLEDRHDADEADSNRRNAPNTEVLAQ